METSLNNKFYVPDISEFHVGFEYEELTGVDNEQEDWTLKVFRKRDFEDLEISCTRVKYLDQQDIEDLGFIYTGKSIDIWFKKEGSFDIGNWTSYEIKLHYGLHDNRLYIIAVDCGDETTLFQGKIKNKSELKKILQQVGVL